MTKKKQILFAYLFHILLLLVSFFILHERADAFFVTVGIIYGAYLIFYIVVNCIERPLWILLLHHLIGSVAQFLLHYFEIIPSDGGGFFGGIGQYIYALFAIPGYFALLLLTHLVLFVIYLIRNRK